MSDAYLKVFRECLADVALVVPLILSVVQWLRHEVELFHITGADLRTHLSVHA